MSTYCPSSQESRDDVGVAEGGAGAGAGRRVWKESADMLCSSVLLSLVVFLKHRGLKHKVTWSLSHKGCHSFSECNPAESGVFLGSPLQKEGEEEGGCSGSACR